MRLVSRLTLSVVILAIVLLTSIDVYATKGDIFDVTSGARTVSGKSVDEFHRFGIVVAPDDWHKYIPELSRVIGPSFAVKDYIVLANVNAVVPNPKNEKARPPQFVFVVVKKSQFKGIDFMTKTLFFLDPAKRADSRFVHGNEVYSLEGEIYIKNMDGKNQRLRKIKDNLVVSTEAARSGIYRVFRAFLPYYSSVRKIYLKSGYDKFMEGYGITRKGIRLKSIGYLYEGSLDKLKGLKKSVFEFFLSKVTRGMKREYSESFMLVGYNCCDDIVRHAERFERRAKLEKSDRNVRNRANSRVKDPLRQKIFPVNYTKRLKRRGWISKSAQKKPYFH